MSSLFRAQEPPAETPKTTEAPAVFSGTVVQWSPGWVTVNRKGLGTNAATKTFAISHQTKVEGKIRLNVKITVQFMVEEDGQAKATYIIVR